MESVTHRELRNSSGEVLRRVAAGESLLVTNSGEPAAVLSPVGLSALDQVDAAGGVRRATRPVTTLRAIRRRSSPTTTADILDDVRGPL